MKPIKYQFKKSKEEDPSIIKLNEMYNTDFRFIRKVLITFLKQIYYGCDIQLGGGQLNNITDEMTIEFYISRISYSIRVNNPYTGQELKDDIDTYKDLFEVKDITFCQNDSSKIRIVLKHISNNNLETLKSYYKLKN